MGRTSDRVGRSVSFDRDVLEWLQERGERLDVSVDWQIRQITRAAMNTERAEQQEQAS